MSYWSDEFREKVHVLRDAMLAVLEDDSVAPDAWNNLRIELRDVKCYIADDAQRREKEQDEAERAQAQAIYDADRARRDARYEARNSPAQQAASEAWSQIVWSEWTNAGREAREALILEALDADGVGITALEGRIKDRLRPPELEGFRLWHSPNVYTAIMPMVHSGRVAREKRQAGKRQRWFYSLPPAPLSGPILDLDRALQGGGAS